MSKPQTQFEAEGVKTQLAWEEDFLKQIVADTPARLSEVGKSYLEQSIWRVEVGNPSGTPMIVLTAVHGDEWATREGALAWIRDLAYSDDPETLGFLEDHLVILVTPVNPDGWERPSRTNWNRVDLNRDWYSITQPESRAVTRLFREVQPVLLADLHEWTNSDDAFQFGYQVADLVTVPRHPAIRDVNVDLWEWVLPKMEDLGYYGREWPEENHPLAQQKISEVASPMHTLGVLTETRRGGGLSSQVRVSSNYDYLNILTQWFFEHSEQAATARLASIADAEAGISNTRLSVKTETGGRGPWADANAPDSYTLPEDFDIPYELLELHEIEIDGRTISTHQKARGFIPALFDPASYFNVIERTWYPTRDSDASNVDSRTFGTIQMDGVMYPIQSLTIKKDGVLYPVQSLDRREGNVIYPIH